MSYFSDKEPVCHLEGCPKDIQVEIIPRTADVGGFEVHRALPSKEKRTVGPFVFWDEMGPGEFLINSGIDVRPHPHICLSTMTYLFDGMLAHRDTLGSFQIITPGAVNLMTAGRGIAHSERTPMEERAHSNRLFGIQCWLALPLKQEEMNPAFQHYDKNQIPMIDEKNLNLRVVSGEYEGLKSPVNSHMDALFIEGKMKATAEMIIPKTVEERAIFILSGEIAIGGIHYGDTRMLVLASGHPVKIQALKACHFIILGGPALEAPRYIWWNFVASSKERIEQAKIDWKEGRFGKIPGDEKEFIPLPE